MFVGNSSADVSRNDECRDGPGGVPGRDEASCQIVDCVESGSGTAFWSVGEGGVKYRRSYKDFWSIVCI